MKYYNDLVEGDVNGKSTMTDAYLDRTIAHEMTHAVMAANTHCATAGALQPGALRTVMP